jgi:hypothetical protein
MKRYWAVLLYALPLTTIAQISRDVAPLTNWPAPLYWQPDEPAAKVVRRTATPNATSLPVGTNALVFVAMTPCRVVDTRPGPGFPLRFGPPSLSGGVSRTFPIRDSTTCSIPSVAQAYSFNVTVAPQGPLGFLTLWPTGQSQPVVSTLNSPQGQVIANAAIVPAGTLGDVDAYATNPTDLIIDINGYYAPPTDIQLINTALGFGALDSNSTGQNNTALGASALTNNTSGSYNSAVGTSSLLLNTNGSYNTAVGSAALVGNLGGGSNTAVGYDAMYYNSIGGDNTALGAVAVSQHNRNLKRSLGIRRTLYEFGWNRKYRDRFGRIVRKCERTGQCCDRS